MYNIKELEKFIPKKCSGISSMVVKEIIQNMIDEDGIISVEKCGNINVYWCFKNQIVMKMYEEIRQLKTKIEETKRKIDDSKEHYEVNESTLRNENFTIHNTEYKRSELMLDKVNLDNEIKELRNVYNKLSQKKWSKEMIETRLLSLSTHIKHLNQMTDNIYCITDFLKYKYFIDPKDLREEINMPEEFEEFEILKFS